MDCSVLVPVFNEKDHIVASVEAIARQRFPGAVEFLLVDGGSTDGTVEILRALASEDSRIRLLENPRRAIPAGLNIALANARGSWVARMDAHSQYPPDYLLRGVERLERGGTRWVSGPAVPVGRDALGRACAFALTMPVGQGGSAKWQSAPSCKSAEHELDSGVFGGVWRRETLLEYGGWDERWPRNEDSELAARFHERGERLLCLPSMGAQYWPRQSLRSLWRQYLTNGEFRAKTARWHPSTLRRSTLMPSGVVLADVAALSGPRPIRRLARGCLCVYGAVLGGAAGVASRRMDCRRDAALVPAVLAVMHLGFGAGFIRGMWRHGLPLAGVGAAVGLNRLADRLSPTTRPVFAPSLAESARDAGVSEPLRLAA